MADSEMSNPATKPKKDRSPAYPFISLKAAVERLIALEAKFGRHPVPALKAGIAWGIKPESSQSAQILAALRSYGLIEYTGSNANRVAALTDDARNYLRAQQESIRNQILKTAALRPKAISTYYAKWGRGRPIDEICLDELVLKGAFTESAARVFLRVYDDTLAYADLTDGDKMPIVSEETSEELVDEPEVSRSPALPSVSVAPTAPQSQPTQAVRALAPAKGVGMRQEVFALTEGDVTIQWPERLSPESMEDFSDWLRILERKVKRNALAPAAQAQPSASKEDGKDGDDDL